MHAGPINVWNLGLPLSSAPLFTVQPRSCRGKLIDLFLEGACTIHQSNVGCCCRYATAAGVGIASLGLALSANAANVKLGATGGALVFDPAEVTIKSGETVTWTNNIGYPHNIVFDEDNIPVSLIFLLMYSCQAAMRKPATLAAGILHARPPKLI